MGMNTLADVSYSRPGRGISPPGRHLTQDVSYESGAELGLAQPYGKACGLFSHRMGNHTVAKWAQKSFRLAGTQDRELSADEPWRLLHVRIRCLPLTPFSDTTDLRPRISLDDSLVRANGPLALSLRPCYCFGGQYNARRYIAPRCSGSRCNDGEHRTN